MIINKLFQGPEPVRILQKKIKLKIRTDSDP